MSHMSTAFKVLRKVNKTVQGIVPSLDQASDDINSTLTETMSEMGRVTPSINLNIRTESGEELVEEARRLAEQRAEEMKVNLGVSAFDMRKAVDESENRIPILATGEEGDEEPTILGTMYRPQPVDHSEERVLQYAAIHNGNVDITDASTVLKMPSDDVEQAMLTLMAQGKVKVDDNGGSR
jgi:hypothetical protein